MAATNHKKSRIGLTKNLQIVADGTTINTIRVYGGSIGLANRNTAARPNHKHVKPPTANHHTFGLISWADIGDDTIEMEVTTVHTGRGPGRGTDDITVTIVIDEGTTDPDTTECTFKDVEFV